MQRTQTQPRSETVPVIRVVVAKEGGMTSSYELTTTKVQFGRSPDCEVRLEGKNISRVHAILEAREGNLWVRDNDSLNGIFVNGEKVKEAILTARDGVKVGPYRFKAIITGTATVAASTPASGSRAAVPASAPAPELDRTLPAFDTRKAKSNDPLPAEDEPLRARPSSSTGPLLEEFIPVAKGTLDTEDRTPADGVPAAAPAQPIRPAAPAPVVAKAEAPIAPAKPSYRSTFEKQTSELPKAAEIKAEAPVAPAPAAPRMPVATRGRMSLTNPGSVKKSPATLKAGDLCPSCSEGRLLTWQGALKCRNSKCGNEAQIGEKPSLESKSISAKAPIAKAPVAKAPAVSVEEAVEVEAPKTSSKGDVLPGELCGSCYKGKMLTWEGSLKCRSCGNTAEIPASFKSGAKKSIAKSNARPSISARPSITPAARPAAPAPSAPVVSRPAPIAAKAAAPSLRPQDGALREADVQRRAKTSSGVKAGDLCDSCSRGRMLTWEGSLKCRACGTTAELGGSVSAKAERIEAPVARVESVEREGERSEVREPNRTAAAITGAGLFVALYATVGLSWIVQSIFVVASTPNFNF